MDIVFQCFLYHKGEMRALGTITIKIFPLVAVPFDGIRKHFLGLVDLHPDFGEITELEGSPILIDEVFQVNTVKLEIIIAYIKTFLRKIEGLFHQVGVRIIHGLVQVVLYLCLKNGGGMRKRIQM